MRRSLLLAIVLIIGFSGTATSFAQTSNTESLTRKAKYIFRGKVQKLKASNLRALPATANTAVVLVEEVLYAPPTLNDFTNQAVTVQLVNPGSLKSGQEAVFYTNGWLYGETIAVIEVAHVAGRSDSDTMRKEILAVHQRVDDEKLLSRIDKAALVIAGTVKATRPLDKSDRKSEISEHYPDWWQAVIEVQSVEKGQSSGREVTILYPNSLDEMWLLSPKFKRGDTGIWILQRDQSERGFPIFRVPGLTALDSIDFQPLSALDRIRRLTKTRK